MSAAPADLQPSLFDVPIEPLTKPPTAKDNRSRSLTERFGDEYKLNNDYRAFYARLLMANEPELAGFFETRGEDNEHCL